jgi:hypothetical protein
METITTSVDNAHLFYMYKHGKINKLISMQDVDKNLQPVIDSINRPLYAILDALKINTNIPLKLYHSVNEKSTKMIDPVFLYQKTLKIMKLNEDIMINFNECSTFTNNKKTEIIITTNAVKQLVNSTQIIVPNDNIKQILYYFYNMQIINDNESIYLNNILRCCNYKNVSDPKNKLLYTNTIKDTNKKINDIIETMSNHDFLLKIKNEFKLIENKLFESDEILNIMSKLLKLISKLRMNIHKLDISYESYLTKDNDAQEILIDLKQFRNDIDDCEKYTKMSIVLYNFLNNEYENQLAPITKLLNENETLNIISPLICTAQKMFSLSNVDINNKFIEKIQSGSIIIKNEKLVFIDNVNKDLMRYSILCANVSGIDGSTDAKAKLYMLDDDIIDEKLITNSINILFDNLKKIIINNDIEHFSYVCFGIGSLLFGFKGPNNALITNIYTEVFYECICKINKQLNIYVNINPGNIYFINNLIDIINKNTNKTYNLDNIQSDLQNSSNSIIHINKKIIIVFHKKDPISIATQLSYKSEKVMIINPCDVISILMWEYGHYWNGVGYDYIAGEEMFVNMSTMALMYPIIHARFKNLINI